MSKSKLLITNRFLPVAESITLVDGGDYSLIFIINFPLPFFLNSIGFREVVINIAIIFGGIGFRRDIIDIATIFNIKRPFFGTGIFNIIIRKASILVFNLT